MDFSNVLISELTVEQFVQISTFIIVFCSGMIAAVSFFAYNLYQFIKFVFSCVSTLIKRKFSKSNNKGVIL